MTSTEQSCPTAKNNNEPPWPHIKSCYCSGILSEKADHIMSLLLRHLWATPWDGDRMQSPHPPLSFLPLLFHGRIPGNELCARTLTHTVGWGRSHRQPAVPHGSLQSDGLRTGELLSTISSPPLPFVSLWPSLRLTNPIQIAICRLTTSNY